jgi:hypothetical protein
MVLSLVCLSTRKETRKLTVRAANVDDRKPVIQSGASDDRLFQSLLYSVTDLDPAREHVVVCPPQTPSSILADSV